MDSKAGVWFRAHLLSAYTAVIWESQSAQFLALRKSALQLCFSFFIFIYVKQGIFVSAVDPRWKCYSEKADRHAWLACQKRSVWGFRTGLYKPAGDVTGLSFKEFKWEGSFSAILMTCSGATIELLMGHSSGETSELQISAIRLVKTKFFQAPSVPSWRAIIGWTWRLYILCAQWWF